MANSECAYHPRYERRNTVHEQCLYKYSRTRASECVCCSLSVEPALVCTHHVYVKWVYVLAPVFACRRVRFSVSVCRLCFCTCYELCGE